MKTCRKCGATKPLTGFHRNQKMADGRLHTCVTCARVIAVNNRRKNLARYVAYDRARPHTPDGKMDKAQRDRRHLQRHPLRRAAYAAVKAARRAGTLQTRPCEQCGEPKTQAHHHDYSKPLDVVWLCRTHHLAEHGKQLHPEI